MKKYIKNTYYPFYSLHCIFKKKENAFLTEFVKRNSFIIIFAAISAIFFQTINISRVFFSASKLSTLNNRIYFSFYTSLLIVSLLVFIIHVSNKASYKKLYLTQYISVVFYIYWNLLLNSYNITRNASGSSTIFISAFLFCSVLMRFKLQHIIFLQITSFLSFVFINLDFTIYNSFFDLMVIVLFSSFCSIVLFFQEVRSLENEDELMIVNDLLKKEQDNLRLSLEKYNYIVNKTNVLSFDWNLETNILTPSNNCTQVIGLPNFVYNPGETLLATKKIHKEDRNTCLELIKQCIQTLSVQSMDIRFLHADNKYHWYQLQLFVQTNQNNKPTSITGTLLNIDEPTRIINNLNKQLTTQFEGSKQYLDQLKDSQEQTKIYRHDMRHSLALIEQLAASGDLDKLCSYLSQTHNNLNSITPHCYCENKTVNLILVSFASKAKELDILFDTNVSLPELIVLSDVELSSLLFNLLENAIIATSKVEQKNRYIKIKANYHLEKLLLFVENSFEGTVSFDNENLPITPNNKEEHGFGIKSIISIVEKHQGVYSFETIDSIFYAKVMLSPTKSNP